jgi:hypothetical protein
MSRVKSLASASASILVVWLASRIMLLGFVRHWFPYRGDAVGDVKFYHDWSKVLLHGHFPTDARWQYPPGATLPILAPRLVPFGGYLNAFMATALLADLVILVALLWFGRRTGSKLGAWYWVVGLPLVGPIALGRYDVHITMLVVLALVVTLPRTRGFWTALAVMVKLWPATLVVGMNPRSRKGRGELAWTGGFIAAMVAATVFVSHAYGFLDNQNKRGLEVEALPATPFMFFGRIGPRMGIHWHRFQGFWVKERYGSMEIVNYHADKLARYSMALMVIAAALLVLWWWRARFTAATPYDAALTATLFFVLTNKVISPQYMIWLAGIAAVCMAVKGSSQRPVALLLLLVYGLTQIEFPIRWFDIIWRHQPWYGAGALVLRNVLLLAASVLSYVLLWRSTRRQEETAADDGAEEPPATATEQPAALDSAGTA